MTTSTSPNRSGAHDFDFLHGSWHIVNERLASRLTGSTEWERFDADHECWPILGGAGNVDTFRPAWPEHEGFEGASLRLFNPKNGLWSIYWMDNVACELFPPVVGRIVDGAGEFFGDDHEGGVPVRVRFRWSEIGSARARWEQAFSTDGGETWETNWIMTMTRRPAG